MKMGHIKLSTKLSLTFGAIIFIISIAILLYINITIQNSLNNQPIVKSVAPNAISIILNKDMENQISYYLPINSDEFMRYIRSTEMSLDRFNRIFQSEILTRILKYSLFAAVIVGVLSFTISNQITKRLMKPLTQMVKVTQSITLQNLEERIHLPKTDDETTKLIHSYNMTLDRLQGAFADLDDFNAYASHELRNSLAVLRNCMEAVRDEQDKQDNIHQALDYLDNLTGIVDDMMAMSSRQLKDQGEYVDLALLAAQAADEYQIEKRIINLEFPEEGVQYIYGKEIWLYRVICNLLDNAIKNSPKDSPINMKLYQLHSAVILEVTDEGKGIEESDLENIWKPYYTRPSSKGKGTGIGLTMVHHVISALGGIVWVESRAERGTSFYISLPVIRPCMQEAFT